MTFEDELRETEALIEQLEESEDYDELIARLEEIDGRLKELLGELKKDIESAQP